VISFTADLDIAKGIVDSLRDVVEIANGRMTYQDVQKLMEEDGLFQEKDVDPKRFTEQGLRWNHGSDIDSRQLAFEAYRELLTFSRNRYNPVFFAVRADNFKDIKPEAIGIVACKVDMTQVTEYLMNMEEFRVPIPAIMSVKRVLY
jgi:hypothetical protein